MDDAEKAKFLLRQRERTIDNVKRLFAVVFALSFTTLGRNAFDSAKDFVIGTKPIPTWDVVAINIEMLAVFAVTASVFYHQGTKFLDWRYAFRERDEAAPTGFAIDFFIVVVTMIPFILMANSMDREVTRTIGFTAFFFSYMLLLTLGLALLLFAQFRSTQLARNLMLFSSEKLSPEELKRDRSLRTYWLVMNTGVYLLIGLLFNAATEHGNVCPLKITVTAPLFLVAFGVVTILRDVVDFGFAWPFLYPVADPKYLWPIPAIRDRSFPVGPFEGFTFVGWVLLAAGLLVAFHDRWWDYHYWATTCARVH